MTEEEMLAAIEQAKAEKQAEIDALAEKNYKLIDKMNTAKKAAEDAANLRSQLNTLQTQLDEATGNTAAIEERTRKAEADKQAALIAELEAERKRVRDLTVGSDLNAAFAAHKVPDAYHEPLKALYGSKAEVKDGAAILDGKPLRDALDELFKSDGGKAFLPTTVTTGDGAAGNRNPVSSGGYTKETFTLTEFSKMAKTDRAKAVAISKAVGTTHHGRG